VAQGAAAVLARKGPQGTSPADGQWCCATAPAPGCQAVPDPFHPTGDGAHGRIDTRRGWATRAIAGRDPAGRWPGRTRSAMLEATRDLAAQTTTAGRFLIPTLPAEAHTLLHAGRSPWTLATRRPWGLDIAWREDDSRMRQGHAPHNFAGLRPIALHLLQQDTTGKRGLTSKRLNAGWDHDSLLHLLRG
jgi:predicted transposase YbfD/YdcC